VLSLNSCDSTIGIASRGVFALESALWRIRDVEFDFERTIGRHPIHPDQTAPFGLEKGLHHG
jgi:hypothetical protein